VASSNVEALPETESRTDLHSHANMQVVGSEAYGPFDAAMADEMSIQYDSLSLDEALYQGAWEGDFKMSIGATHATDQVSTPDPCQR
jgi:hypothetical protein